MMFILSCEKIENGGGIYSYELAKSGELIRTRYYACDRPMYAVKCDSGLCVLLRQPFSDSDNSGYFYIDEELKNATEIKSTRGKCACHLCVDGDNVYIVNYLSGNIVKNGEDVSQRSGKSVHPIRQTSPHTHFVGKTPDGNYIVCDLGTDSLCFYNKELKLVDEEKVPTGYGIRHIVFSKNGKYIYAMNELVPSVSVFSYKDHSAVLLNTQIIDCKNKSANGAAIRISECGRYLYSSIREENIICVFEIKGENILLLQKNSCGGDSPRDFNIINNLLICCNENSDNISVYRLKNGKVSERLCDFKLNKPLCCVV